MHYNVGVLLNFDKPFDNTYADTVFYVVYLLINKSSSEDALETNALHSLILLIYIMHHKYSVVKMINSLA